MRPARYPGYVVPRARTGTVHEVFRPPAFTLLVEIVEGFFSANFESSADAAGAFEGDDTARDALDPPLVARLPRRPRDEEEEEEDERLRKKRPI